MKHLLRTRLLNEREKLGVQERKQLEHKIVNQIIQLKLIEDKRNILIYYPIHHEVDALSIIQYYPQQKFYLPVIKKREIIARLFSIDEKLIIGQYGIPVPLASSQSLSGEKLDLIIVPGLAFDKNGHRLGYGKGYYDILLSQTNAIKIGICFDFQLIDHLKNDPHDQAVDYVITDQRIIQPNPS